jgi:hypothetical protein
MQDSWKTFVITTALGLTAAIAYLVVTPQRFEGVAQIRMAQIGSYKPANQSTLTNPTNINGVPVEDPASLIARMQIPTNYDQTSITACGYGDMVESAQVLASSLKLTIPKGLTNTVELKALGLSPQQAEDCVSSILTQITKLQAQLAAPFVLEAKLKLALDNERIESARRLINNSDQSSSVILAAYISARDEINYLLTDREKMLDMINSAEQRGTKLISPIYVSKTAVSPKKSSSLAAGLFIGLFLGLGIALVRQFWKNWSIDPNLRGRASQKG